MRPHAPVERWEVYLMWAVSLAIELINMGANFLSARRAKKAELARRRPRRRKKRQ